MMMIMWALCFLILPPLVIAAFCRHHINQCSHERRWLFAKLIPRPFLFADQEDIKLDWVIDGTDVIKVIPVEFRYVDAV